MDPFVAEIRIFPFNFAPRGWAFCNGQLMPISQNTALFSLLGTTYGGDGKSSFALPNLQGKRRCIPVKGQGCLCTISAKSEAPKRSRCSRARYRPHHNFRANNTTADTGTPTDSSVGRTGFNAYQTTINSNLTPMAPQGLPGWCSQPHNNLQPYLTLNFCIAMQGVFPPRG